MNNLQYLPQPTHNIVSNQDSSNETTVLFGNVIYDKQLHLLRKRASARPQDATINANGRDHTKIHTNIFALRKNKTLSTMLIVTLCGRRAFPWNGTRPIIQIYLFLQS